MSILIHYWHNIWFRFIKFSVVVRKSYLFFLLLKVRAVILVLGLHNDFMEP